MHFNPLALLLLYFHYCIVVFSLLYLPTIYMSLYSVVSPVLIKLYYHCVAPCNKLYHNTTESHLSCMKVTGNNYNRKLVLHLDQTNLFCQSEATMVISDQKL